MQINAETKKLLAIMGSPHTTGHTARLLGAFLKAKPDNVTAEVADAFNLKVRPCIGCGRCGESYGCAYNSENSLFSDVEAADYIVIATPVYLFSFPAPLKAVFDRFEQYYNARFRLGMKPAIKKQKKAFLIITQGSAGSEGADIIEKQATAAFSVMNTSIAGRFVLGGTDNASEWEIIAACSGIESESALFFIN